MSRPGAPKRHQDVHPPPETGGEVSGQPCRSVPATSRVGTVKRWKSFLGNGGSVREGGHGDVGEHAKWSLGVLNDKRVAEVPGSVLLLSSTRQRPLGLHLQPARTSSSSLPPQPGLDSLGHASIDSKKRTANGEIILNPQPDDSLNDPLNWPIWRRNTALLSLGWHCLVGGGMTPILAAGFKNVAETYHVSIPQVALTTGLFMMGLGMGSVLTSPTAILYGKRPVYLVGTLVFLAGAVWCSESPSYASLVIARIVMGLSISPCESLPSATIAEIFFLHERAYRGKKLSTPSERSDNPEFRVEMGISVNHQQLRPSFTYANLTPRIVAIVVAFNFVLLFLFVPETFWDRTPRPKISDRGIPSRLFPDELDGLAPSSSSGGGALQPEKKRKHVEWAEDKDEQPHSAHDRQDLESSPVGSSSKVPEGVRTAVDKGDQNLQGRSVSRPYQEPSEKSPPFLTSPSGLDTSALSSFFYTDALKNQPPLKFRKTLKPWNGRLRKDNWFRVALRPLILFAYPAVLWSALVYSLAVGWLIVLSETVASVYQHNPYNFTPLGTGLVYLSPSIGGILGTVVAGKVSDIIVRFMTKKNGGLYEPEFRLVMAIPVAVCTSLGLMGFGWSADAGDKWIVPTVFFGVISFGCSLGSTTAITFCVDSYRQYAGEALVTLNFSKNIFHGLVFSLFINRWLDAQGPKSVFLSLGVIQLACLAFTIPLYIFGKRMRMWTVRKNLMERF
ncbi:MAG: hypothetical protein M1840_005752 [Geoglossum simile]|nr:MAG: hypothetical protein M1840_005752 [Geoglossum simile]